MGFQEKSNWIMFVTLSLVGGWYFGPLGLRVINGDTVPGDLGRDFATLALLVVFIAVPAHIAVAALNPDESDAADERDKLIETRADARSSYVIGAGALWSIGLAYYEADVFWVANAALAGLVIGEIVKGLLRAVDYRRGV